MNIAPISPIFSLNTVLLRSLLTNSTLCKYATYQCLYDIFQRESKIQRWQLQALPLSLVSCLETINQQRNVYQLRNVSLCCVSHTQVGQTTSQN